jgi:hypothetical protein
MISAGLIVGPSDDRGIGHVGVAEQDRLQLGRGHLETLVLDELLEPVDHVQVPVRVHVPEVAGVQPPVRVDGRRRGLGVVQVSLHHLGPAHPDLPFGAGVAIGAGHRVDDPGLRARGGDPHRSGPEPTWRGQVRHGGQLRHPVALYHVAAEPLAALGRQLRLQRSGAGVHQPHGAEVERVHQRVPGQGEHDGRGDERPGDPVVLMGPQELLQVESRQRDHRRPGPQSAVHHALHAIDVEERQHSHEPLVGR